MRGSKNVSVGSSSSHFFPCWLDLLQRFTRWKGKRVGWLVGPALKGPRGGGGDAIYFSALLYNPSSPEVPFLRPLNFTHFRP